MRHKHSDGSARSNLSAAAQADHARALQRLADAAVAYIAALDADRSAGCERLRLIDCAADYRDTRAQLVATFIAETDAGR